MKIRKLVNSAMITAIYIVLMYFVQPLGFGAIQFRVSEGLNHLAVFHKDYKWGVVLGVFLSNLMFSASLGIYDIVFGTLHTLLSFLVAEYLFRFAKDTKRRMIIISLVFSVMIFIIALELFWVIQLPFWLTYFTTFLSELIIMGITAPLFYYLDKRLNFRKLMEG